ncbi:hypothetical protein JST97_32415 [bacterium]|nr:hypothetical protein [bacterium]
MKKRGYALPLSLCVAGVTLLLGFSAASMTHGDLNTANHQYYQERARQAADFGLEYAVSHSVAPGSTIPLNSLSNPHPHDSVKISIYLSDTPGSPVQVPAGFEYWVAEGHASESAGGVPLASARIGALVRYGFPTGTAGAQIRSLVSAAGPDPVDFVVRDGLSGQTVLNEPIIASDYDGGSLPLPFPSDQNHILDLGRVNSFQGNFRLPRNTNQNVIHQNGSTPISVTQDGGPANTPGFAPPAGLNYAGDRTLPDGYNDILESGHYATLTIPASATVHLKGTYHFDTLKLSDSTAAGQGGLLQVNPTDSAKVFVDRLRLGQGSLGLSNLNGAAQNFRFTLQSIPPGRSEPVLNFKLPNGGAVAMVADGHRLSLEADSTSREIRGAFSAAALKLSYPPASSGNNLNPAFVYDVSATTARRSHNDSTTNGDSSTTESLSELQSGRTDLGDLNTQGGPTIAHPPGLEPMILSRQAL